MRFEILDIKKPRVGVVGEILVKFLPAANNHLVDLLESEGAEAVVPDLAGLPALLLLQPEFQGFSSWNEKVKGNPCEISEFRLWNGSVNLPRDAFAERVNTLIRLQRLKICAHMASEIVLYR